jgi:hypothetical protein
MDTDRELPSDGESFARGCLTAVPIALGLWALIIGGIWLLVWLIK